MLQYQTKEDIFFSYDHAHAELSFLQYALFSTGTLFIRNIEVPTHTKFLYPDIHHGTELFNQFLLHLQTSTYPFDCIQGLLSWSDAERRNWIRSIPFYDDFHKYKDSALRYDLKFHLYDHDNYTNEIFLPSDSYDRIKFIEIFCQKHLYPPTNASFMYTLQ